MPCDLPRFEDVVRTQGALFVWIDSSPQGKANWLLSLVVYIRGTDMAAAAQAADYLVTSVGDISSALASQGHAALEDIAMKRNESAELLHKVLKRHRQIPIALGSGQAGALHKFRVLVRKVLAESSNFMHLSSLMSSIHSVTTDLGAEGGIADLQVPLIQAIPKFMQSHSLPVLDVGEMSGIDAEEYLLQGSYPAPSPLASEYSLPFATTVPGMLHICHNIDADLPEHLSFYPHWLQGLKPLVRLLHHDHWRKRLIATCVAGRFEQFRDTFKTCLPAFAEWRWGLVVQTLQLLLPKKIALQVVWDPQRFDMQKTRDGTGADQDEASLDRDHVKPGSDGELHLRRKDLPMLTEAIRSEDWWLYARMLLTLHSHTNHIASWVEGCDCHYFLQPASREEGGDRHCDAALALEKARRRLHLRSGLDGVHCQACPLAGCRAPALAAKKLQEFMEAIYQPCFGNLLSTALHCSGEHVDLATASETPLLGDSCVQAQGGAEPESAHNLRRGHKHAFSLSHIHLHCLTSPPHIQRQRSTLTLLH